MHLLIKIFSVACFLSVSADIKNKYLTYVRKGIGGIINMIFHNHNSTLISLPPPSLCSHIVHFIGWKYARPFWILLSGSWVFCLWVTRNRMLLNKMLAFQPEVVPKWDLEEDRSVILLWKWSLHLMQVSNLCLLNAQKFSLPPSMGYWENLSFWTWSIQATSKVRDARAPTRVCSQPRQAAVWPHSNTGDFRVNQSPLIIRPLVLQ